MQVEASKDDPVSVKFLNDPETQKLVSNTSVLSEAKVADYDAIFYVGGHGKAIRTLFERLCNHKLTIQSSNF
jgi:putative intracellular protease/amidase